jgi:hypothetical protein
MPDAPLLRKAQSAALAVTGVVDSLAIGLDAGVLVISLDPSLPRQHSRP